MTRTVGGLAVVLVLAGCGGGSGKSDPGKVCQYNSDCQSGLTCSFGRCMAACQAEADCPAGQQCVQSSSGLNVCLLPEVEKCVYTSQCQSPLVCALDFKCRNQCLTNIDCATKTQRCILPDGVCAEPTAIDPATGGLKPPAGLDGGLPDSALDVARPDPDVAPIEASAVPDTFPATPDSLRDLPVGADTSVGPGVSNLDAAALTLPSSIATDMTLPYQSGCRYRITTQVFVDVGATLTVAPGVTIDVASGGGLTIRGALSAAGTADLPIHFTGTQATPGYWKGILFENSDNVANVLDHVVIEHAGTMTTSGVIPASPAR